MTAKIFISFIAALLICCVIAFSTWLFLRSSDLRLLDSKLIDENSSVIIKICGDIELEASDSSKIISSYLGRFSTKAKGSHPIGFFEINFKVDDLTQKFMLGIDSKNKDELRNFFWIYPHNELLAGSPLAYINSPTLSVVIDEYCSSKSMGAESLI